MTQTIASISSLNRALSLERKHAEGVTKVKDSKFARQKSPRANVVCLSIAKLRFCPLKLLLAHNSFPIFIF